MAAILNSAILDSDTAILDSDTLLSFSQIHSKTLFPPLWHKNSIWLKLIHSDSTWWWQPSWILPSWILPSWIQPFCSKLTLKDWFPPIWLKLIHSDSTWWWQPSWILPCWIQTLPSWIQTPCLSSLRFTQKHSHSTLTLTQTNSIWLKLIHSDSTWWWQPSWILPSAILNLAILDSAILVFPLKLTHTCQDWFPPFAQKKLHSFILTQLDDGSHLEFCHVGFRHCHLGFRHLVIFSQIHSKTLSLHSDSDSN